MSVMSSTARVGAVAAFTGALVAGSLTTTLTTGAEASTASAKALKVAASKKGDPYRYGATGPNSFDCSGLTQYSYRKAGKRLPRTAAQQYRATRHIAKSARKPGDLVFFVSRGNVYHVGVYAGGGKIWHAPKPGTRVRLERIWTTHTLTGRVK